MKQKAGKLLETGWGMGDNGAAMHPDPPASTLPYGQADIHFHRVIGVALLPPTLWGALSHGGRNGLMFSALPLALALIVYAGFRVSRRWKGRRTRAASPMHDRRVFLRVLAPAMAIYLMLKPFALQHVSRVALDAGLLVGIGAVALLAGLVPWARASFYRRASSVFGGATLIVSGALLPLIHGGDRIAIFGLLLMAGVLGHAAFMQHLLKRQAAEHSSGP